MAKVVSVKIPEYVAGLVPDSSNIGLKLEKVLEENWQGKEIVIRAISSEDHNLALDELVKVVLEEGSDRYDASIKGTGYDISATKRIDFFATPCRVGQDAVFAGIIEAFYHNAIGDRGRPVRINLVIIYDLKKLTMVEELYEGCVESDGYIFNDPNKKTEALLGLIKIL